MSASRRFMVDLRERLSEVTVDQVAEAAQVSRALAGTWKRGSRVPSREQLVKALRKAGADKVVLKAGQGANGPRTELHEWVERYDRLGQRSMNRDLVDDGPVQAGAPPPQAAALQRREDAQARVVQSWADDQTSPMAVVVGSAGVGKSQLAAALFRDDTSLVKIWVDASAPVTLRNGFAAAAQAVQARGHTSADVDVAARAFLTWLSGARATWLVVLDDVESVEVMDGWWPPAGGRTLVTTRSRDIAAAAGGTLIDLDVFSNNEGVTYLTERLSAGLHTGDLPPTALDDAAALVRDVGCHPLVLAQVAAVVELEGCTCADVRKRLGNRATAVDEVLPSAARADSYQGSVSAVVELALEKAAHADPQHLIPAIMAMGSLVDPAGAPESLWATGAARQVFELMNAETSPEASYDATFEWPAIRRALRTLHRFSILHHDVSHDPALVRTHAMVQRVVRDGLSSAALPTIIRATATALMQMWPVGEVDPQLSATLRANARSVLGHDCGALWRPLPHPLLLHVGRTWGEAGDYMSAAEYLSEVAQASLLELGPDHEHTLAARHDRAWWHSRAGHLHAAIKDLIHIVHDAESALGPTHEQTLQARGSLASCRGENGDVHAAMTELDRLIPDLATTLGSTHASTLWLRNSLALLRLDAGEHDAAVRDLTALARDLAGLDGPDHLHTLIVRGNLLRARLLAGDVVKSYRALSELVQTMTNHLGPDHATTLETRGLLAQAATAVLPSEQAEALFDEVCQDVVRVLGPEHVLTLRLRCDQALAQQARVGNAGTSSILSELLVCVNALVGPNHHLARHIKSCVESVNGKGDDRTRLEI